jgi:hypothetical protein
MYGDSMGVVVLLEEQAVKSKGQQKAATNLRSVWCFMW